ncbi:MAG: Lon protease family protein [Planctomycetota bacterium]|jgi:predicted ATP-dependent protease
MREFGEFVRDGLSDALNADAVKARRDALEQRMQSEVKKVSEPFETSLKEAGLALVSVQLGPVAQTALFPVVEGKPVPPEEFEQLRAQEKVTEEQYENYKTQREAFQKRLEEVTEQVRKIHRNGALAIQSVVEETARAVLGNLARQILLDFPGEDIQKYVSEVVDDVAENRLGTVPAQELPDPLHVYGVNLLLEREPDESCPIVIENTPTLANLLGTVDREWTPRGPGPSDYENIRAGSLLRADGGFLIVEVRDVLVEPGAWKVLLRTLRTGKLEIVPPEMVWPVYQPTLKPEPIPINLKVILLGDADIFYLLDRHDPDFHYQFKVLADFDSEIDREPDGPMRYASVLARLCKEEELLPLHKTAVAKLAEHGARIATRRSKLSARFGRIADIAREASFLAKKESQLHVAGTQVVEAIRRTKARADLPSRRFRQLLKDGTIRVETTGAVVGQVNGLAVMSAGPITYGFPARITASMGAGSAGIINIEGQAELSGAIHTKGFHILGGLLRHLLQTDHPLAFSASVAFEQSYGGIDGDSASGAEICCLLSALTGVPIRQEIAITGAIDQVGHIQAIGGVNEKIEGFFDTCQDVGLSGDQGVIIPKANSGDLMLRLDVVEACRAGDFQIYAVDKVEEALEVLTGRPAGERDEEGEYPEESLLGRAVEKAREFWLRSVQSPNIQFVTEEIEEEEESAESDKAAKQ